ncbi:GerAB/ArcD/ProY family transporter [Alicyclobacillus pomorum]|uniref:GerAB/ArcD/ProY family transporter n=1 Tax=Alicyclobacillus pomorum TaxID=204470 RepID=UPI00040ED294|nr:endospore germination permease [Alicyclobacillus pomorum]
MSKVQISRFQIVLALIWSTLGTAIITLPPAIAQFTVRDGWIVSLLFAVGGLLSASVAALFVHALPNRSLTSGLIHALGPRLGRVFGLWFLVWLYLINSTILRRVELFVGTTILPQTPEYLLGFAGMIAVSYAVYMGAEVVMRNGEFITPLAFIVAPVLFGLSLQHVDVHQLMPVLADGWKPVLRGAVTPDLTFALELLIGLQFVQALRNSRTLPKDMIIAAGILTVAATVITVITIGVVGQSANYLAYPVLEAVRSIRVGRNLERLDTLYVMAVMSTILIKLAVFHYAWCEGMKDVFKLSSHRIVALSGGLLVWAGSVACFGSQEEVIHFTIFVAPAYFVVTLVGIPLLTVMVMAFRKRAQR